MAMTVRLPYRYDRRAASEEAQVFTDSVPSKTQQSFREEVDINTIVRRFRLTGSMPPARSVPQYGDFSQVTDFQTALNELRRSQEVFMSLPARIRERFANDPGRLLDFVGDPESLEEARKLGLVPKAPAKGPDVAPVVDASPAAHGAGSGS